MEDSFSLAQDVIGWRQSKTTGETLREKVVVKQFAWANNTSLAGDNLVLDSTSADDDMEMNKEVEQKKLHQMAKVHDLLEMCQTSQNLRATQKESCAQNIQMTAVGYISDTEEMVKASWSLFQHDGAAAFKLSEKSPVPPALSAKHLPGGWSQVLNVCQIKRIDRYPAEIDEDSSPESISNTKNWLNWNGDLHNPTTSEDDWDGDNESDLDLDTRSEDSETPVVWNVSAAPTVPGLIRTIRRAKNKVETALLTVNIMEMRRHKGIKEK